MSATTSRDAITASTLTRSLEMKLMHQELAREHASRRHMEAEHARRARALLAHKRWHRKAERAAYRARLALASL
jgi:hypothetical protein